jgi:pimeloyl-ACP methyl ester carboxylesterase
MPAHGFSDPPRGGISSETMRTGLWETLERLVDEPATVFGNSMGGYAAIRLALDHPDRVRALILCSPGGASMSQEQLDDFRTTFHVESHQDALEFIDKLLGRSSFLRRVFAWGVQRKLTQEDMRNLIDSITIEDLFTAEDLKQLQMPIYMIWGGRDGILPGYHREFFRSHLPDHAVITEPEHFGHSPYLENPGPLSRQILGFLREIHRDAPPASRSA